MTAANVKTATRADIDKCVALIALAFSNDPAARWAYKEPAAYLEHFPPFEPEGKFHGTSAAVEYAATVLNVPNIIVLGHSHCGGVAAYREKLAGKADETSFIGRWLTLLDGLDVKESEVGAFDQETAFELAGIRQSLANLRTFAALKDREAEGLLSLHGLHFDIGSGTVLALDEETDSFAPLPDDD